MVAQAAPNTPSNMQLTIKRIERTEKILVLLCRDKVKDEGNRISTETITQK